MEKKQSVKKWLDNEKEQLLQEINNGKTITEIANIHERSNNAIVMRICEIAKSRIDKKEQTLEEAQKQLKLVTLTAIENYIKRENDKKNKNDDDKKNKNDDEKKKNNNDSKLENKKEDSNDSIITKLNELKKQVDDLQEKYNSLEEKYNKLNTNINTNNLIDSNKQEKKIKIRKSQKE
jgi:hypothetical protein